MRWYKVVAYLAMLWIVSRLPGNVASARRAEIVVRLGQFPHRGSVQATRESTI